MSSAISRAQEAAAQRSGDYLNNDTLIAGQLVFDIIDVMFDQGGGYEGADRWLVKVEPHDENEAEPDGLISLGNNNARRGFFESIDHSLQEAERKGEDAFVGPCVMVKVKGKFRYIAIVEWDEVNRRPILPGGTTAVGIGSEATEMRSRRPRSSNGQSAEAVDSSRRPFVKAAGGSTGTSSATSEPDGAFVEYLDDEPAIDDPKTKTSTLAIQEIPGAAEFPPLKIWAAQNGYDVPARGRPKKVVTEAYERAKMASIGQGNYGAASEPSSEPVEPRTRRARVGASAPARSQQPPEGGAESASEVVWKPGMAGTSVDPCPACGEHVHDRAFPSGNDDGVFVLVHARCPAGAEQSVMEATLDVSEE